jgi:hypothetical protein
LLKAKLLIDPLGLTADIRYQLTDLAEIPVNTGNNYGGQMLGWFRANQDGNHVFQLVRHDTTPSVSA